MDRIAASIAQIAAEALKAGAEARGPALDLPPPVADALAAWISDQPEPRPTLAQAVGRILSSWLSERGYGPPVDAGDGS